MTLMDFTLLSGLEMRMETSRSLEQVRYAIGRCLRSPGAIRFLPNGAAIGSIEEDQFKLYFWKPSRNFWRPEFKGSFSATNDHVTIHVRCGFSEGAGMATFLLWIVFVFVFIVGSGNILTGRASLNNYFSLCMTVFFGFVLPCSMFWNEFRYDKIEMRSILNSIESERNETAVE